MRYTRELRHLLSVALVTALAVACGDDDAGNGPNDIPQASGPAGDVAAAIGEAAATFFVGNEAAYQSVSHFAPLIGGVLNVAPTAGGPAAASAAAQSCFSTNVVGKTFDFDFSQGGYDLTQVTGAPAEGIRFVLYDLDDQGDPQQGDPLGHIDIVCAALLPTVDMTVAIVANDVTVLNLRATGNANPLEGTLAVNFSGYLQDAQGTKAVNIGDYGSSAVTMSQSIPYSSGFDLNISPADQLFVTFGRMNMQDGTFFVGANAQKGLFADNFEWSFYMELFGSPGESVTGRVDIASQGPNGLFACMSGQFDAPDVSAPDDCATQENPAVNGVGAAELAAVEFSYNTMREMWEALDSIINTGIDILMAQATGT